MLALNICLGLEKAIIQKSDTFRSWGLNPAKMQFAGPTSPTYLQSIILIPKAPF